MKLRILLKFGNGGEERVEKSVHFDTSETWVFLGVIAVKRRRDQGNAY